MKQVLQDLATGKTIVEDVPEPLSTPGALLIRTSCTLISAGTEKMLIDFGKGNLFSKAMQQPDKVRQVLDKVKTDGVGPTLQTVRNKLGQPLPTGYCNVGVAEEVGDEVIGFDVGNRIASNGKHAGVVVVPQNLSARIPDSVSDDEAAFTVVGAIGLQGVRLAAPTLGECVVVIGLGLIGLITVQLLRAQGCRVLGIDYDSQKVELAREFGATAIKLGEGADPIAAATTFSRNRGVDAVIITASTKSNEPVHQAATMCRKRGRIVLVGVVGLELSRADFFEKELTFQVSCSYGPGRYDPHYEEGGQDYPVGYVRWTEQRNFEAFLDMLAERRLDMRPLISHQFDIEHATEAYDLISGDDPSLGVLLQFSASGEEPRRGKSIAIASGEAQKQGSAVSVGFIGAGNYASQVLIPAFAKTEANLSTVASASGVTAVHTGKTFGIARASTDADGVISDTDTNTIVITTRHDSHARLVCAALAAGKHVFVEKPLALTLEELNQIREAYEEVAVDKASAPTLMVGFNRRFAPQIVELKRLVQAASQPKSFIATINAGEIPPEHWTQDPQIGGGRIIGEACHFVDLLRHLAGAPITAVQAVRMGSKPGVSNPDDKMTFSLSFDDGSFGTVHYFANGSKSFPKERIEVFCGGGIIQLDNFRKMKGYGWPGFKSMKLGRQDKGNAACVQAFVNSINVGAASPIPDDELFEVHARTFEIADLVG